MQQSEHLLLFGFSVSLHHIAVTAFIVASILWALVTVWLDCRYRLIPWRLTLIGSAMVIAGESLLFHEWTMYCAVPSSGQVFTPLLPSWGHSLVLDGRELVAQTF